jgi:hypothetical protein
MNRKSVPVSIHPLGKLILLVALAGVCGQAGAQEFSAEALTRRALERRAVDAVIWGVPAVNFDLMYQAMVRDAKAGPGSNKIVYWSKLSDWKNQTLTPNPDAVYFMPFFDTKEGPVVLEVPPAGEDGSITGSVMDCWQAALEDVGTAGVDKGKGGKCLILPPGYKEKIPDGYLAMPSDNFQGYGLLRSILKTGGDAGVAKAVAYAKRMKVYPLSQAANPPATTFIDASGVVFEANIPYDARFFDALNRMVQSEPWLTRDKAMIDPLRAIGIEKGKPFTPGREDARDPRRGGEGSACLAGDEIRGLVHAAILRRHRLGPSHDAATHQGFADAVFRSRQLSRGEPWRDLHDGVLQPQALRGRGRRIILPDDDPGPGWQVV